MKKVHPTVILTEPKSVAQSIEDARTREDEYGYRKRFREASIDDLIATFNGDVGNPGWVGARAAFLVALRDALLATGLDCTQFISEAGMSTREQIERHGDAIVVKRRDM